MMKKSIKDSISVDVSRAVADALWDEINKPFRQRNMPQLIQDVHDALEEYGDLLDDSDRKEFEFWMADVEDELNSPHIEDSVEFDPEDYESFKIVNKTSLNNKQYAMIQAKATDQNKPDVFYISSSPDMQPENDRRIYVTRADAEREFDQIKSKADKRRKDSMPSIEKINTAEFVMDPDSDITDEELTANKDLYALLDNLTDIMYHGNYQYEDTTGDVFVIGDTPDGKYSMILWYNEEDDPKKIFITAGINQEEKVEFQDAEPVDYFIADYKSTKPQNKHEEEVLDELIRTIITDKGEDAGSGEWTYVDQGPVQGAIIYTTDIEFKKDENNQFEVIVKKFDVEYDSDY